MSWLLAFLGFATLIVLHELGHFAAAKAVGMRVERFSLFFPPLLAKVRRGETEYAVGAIPLGGYVKITGMNPHEEIPEELAPRAYFRQPVWKRIVVISAGPAVNIVIAFLILWVLYMAVTPRESTSTVEAITPGSPAATALRPGDRILAVDGKRGGPPEFQRAIGAHRCPGEPRDGCRASTPARLTIVRGGERRTVVVAPEYDAGERRTLVGFRFGSRELPTPGPVAAAGDAAAQMWTFTTATVSTIAQVFVPEKREEISGVVGSYEVTRQAIELDTARAFFIIAVISLSLGVINLFPFLPLDGGHIFWALAEKVRGRAIPFAVMERAGFVGFALVIALFMIGLTNDIGRLSGEGFQVR